MGRLLPLLFTALVFQGCAPDSPYTRERDFKVVKVDKTVTITGYTGRDADVRIPPEIRGRPVSGIADGAFAARNLSGVIIPDRITSIGAGAFENNNLTELTIPRGVTVIEDSAFAGNLLSSVIIPDKVTFIGARAFADNRLSRLVIGGGVTGIGQEAFENNDLTELTIPRGVTGIGASAFANNRLASVIDHGGITYIGANAFAGNPLEKMPLAIREDGDDARRDELSQMFRLAGNSLGGLGNTTWTTQVNALLLVIEVQLVFADGTFSLRFAGENVFVDQLFRKIFGMVKVVGNYRVCGDTVVFLANGMYSSGEITGNTLTWEKWDWPFTRK